MSSRPQKLSEKPCVFSGGLLVNVSNLHRHCVREDEVLSFAKPTPLAEKSLERFAKPKSSRSPPRALGTSGERFSDERPVSQRVFMSGHELDGELRVARAAQRVDTLLDLGLACRKRGGAD
jgi:hypothetical protein